MTESYRTALTALQTLREAPRSAEGTAQERHKFFILDAPECQDGIYALLTEAERHAHHATRATYPEERKKILSLTDSIYRGEAYSKKNDLLGRLRTVNDEGIAPHLKSPWLRPYFSEPKIWCSASKVEAYLYAMDARGNAFPYGILYKIRASKLGVPKDTLSVDCCEGEVKISTTIPRDAIEETMLLSEGREGCDRDGPDFENCSPRPILAYEYLPSAEEVHEDINTVYGLIASTRRPA